MGTAGSVILHGMLPLSSVPTWPQPRGLREDEWPALRATVNNIFRPEGGDLTQDCPLLFDPANRENLRVIVADAPDTNDARVIAHAGFVIRDALVFRRRIRVVCVGAIFTTPAERGKGLATRVLLDALRRGRPGADLVMVSGDRDLYRRQGMEPTPPLARFRLPENARRAVGLEVRDITAGDLDSVATLYDAEDVHFVRPPDDWQRLWGAGILVDAPATFSVVLRAGKTVAYVASQRAGRRANGTVRPRRILEFAGDRAAIADAAPLLGDELLVPGYDSSLIALCENKGWFRTARQFLITAEALTADVLVIPWYGLNYL